MHYDLRFWIQVHSPNILTRIIEINYAGIRIETMDEFDCSFKANQGRLNEMEVRNSVRMSEYLLKYIAEDYGCCSLPATIIYY